MWRGPPLSPSQLSLLPSGSDAQYWFRLIPSRSDGKSIPWLNFMRAVLHSDRGIVLKLVFSSISDLLRASFRREREREREFCIISQDTCTVWLTFRWDEAPTSDHELQTWIYVPSVRLQANWSNGVWDINAINELNQCNIILLCERWIFWMFYDILWNKQSCSNMTWMSRIKTSHLYLVKVSWSIAIA